MFNKKFCILTLFLIALLSISVVSAEDSADSVLAVDDSTVIEESIEAEPVLDESIENIEASDDNSDLAAAEELDLKEVENIESVDVNDVTDEVIIDKGYKNTLKDSGDKPYNYYVDPLTTYFLSGKHIYFGWQGYFSGYFRIVNSKGSLVFNEYLSGYEDHRKYCIDYLAAGTYYAGLVDEYYGLLDYSKVVIKKAITKIYVKSFTTHPGVKFHCYAYVWDKKNGKDINGGYVKFKIAGKTYKAKVHNGVASFYFKVPKKVKKYTCKAYYLGAKSAKKSSTKFKMKVKRKKKTKLKKGQYWGYCHGYKNHKAIWTKKYEGKSFDGTVYRNGHYYDRYIKLYSFTCKCTKTKYHKTWLKYHGGKYYSYSTYGPGNHPKYVYVRANLQ